MARFLSLIVLLLASALANEFSNKPEESEFRREMLTNLNKTNEKLDQLMRIVLNQPVEMRKLVEEQNDKLIKSADQRFNQLFRIRFSSKCNLARLSNLTLLSNGKMYSFHPTAATWNSANETCSKKGLHLATIKDQNDAQVVAAEGRRLDEGNTWWVSAKNLESEKDFRWQDGTKLELDSPLWTDGAGKTDDCVRIYNWAKGKLSSAKCSAYWYFICELPSECY
ncbi:collectin-12-like [Neocloeon triangulifer]|uniref:collectin-12-like n=1 Tax=Neocloeon triangulifer TaxID=2078957 RepID=UPI00286FA5AC|nr:collectin-12-like [Neocloeon triangulifer]